MTDKFPVTARYHRRPIRHSLASVRSIGVVLLALFIPILVEAAWIEVEGQAVIAGDDLEGARQMAVDDALRLAAIQSTVRVSGHEELRNGQFVANSPDLAATTNIRRATVVKEWQDGDLFKVTVRANVEPQPMCSADTANQYKKSLLVSGFSLQQPKTGSMGGLSNADRALASYLTKLLSRQSKLLVFESSQYRLYDELINAPTAETQQRTLTKAVMVAKDMGAQFVLSGVIRDMSMHDASSMETSVWSSIKRSFNRVNTERAFALEVFVHDGFSGAIVYQKFYRLDASWDLALNEAAPFDSPAFWNTDYGRAIGSLLDDISWELGDSLRCQPFMTRISKVNGKTLHFASGANTGLRPGDKLNVFRTFSFYDAELLQYTELTDVKATLEVNQVQPHFARGDLMVEAGRLNIQEDDILVAW